MQVAYAWCATLSLHDVAAVLTDIGMVADAIAHASEVGLLFVSLRC